eukprot:8640-Heterococcus_DN1.PRE.2
MDAVFQEVQKKCGTQLRAYEDCVAVNPGCWETKCSLMKANLSRCAAASVEMLRTALDKCSEPVTAYNACLQKNPRQPERCQVSTEIMLTQHWPLVEQVSLVIAVA